MKDEAEGTTKNVTLRFTLTTKDSNLNNTSTTVAVKVDLVKSTVFKTTDGGQFQEVLKKLGSYQYTGITFDLEHATYSGNQISVKNSTSRGEDDPKGNITQLGTDIETDLNGDQYDTEGYFKEVKFDSEKSNPPASGTEATLHFSYTLSNLYEGANGNSNGTFALKADAARTGKNATWEK